jgi:hypothetical protein
MARCGGHFVEQEEHNHLIERIAAVAEAFRVHARQVAAFRNMQGFAPCQSQLPGRGIAQVDFIVRAGQQRGRELAVHAGQLQYLRRRFGFDLRQRSFQQPVVLAEQDGVDDRLMVEEPDAPPPQIRPPVIARQILRNAVEKFLVQAHS